MVMSGNPCALADAPQLPTISLYVVMLNVLLDTYIVLGFITITFGIFAWLSHVTMGSEAGNLGNVACFTC